MANIFKRLWNRVYRPYGRDIHAKTPYSISGGTYVTPDTAMQVSSFYRGVVYICTQIAKLPWEIKDKDNKVTTTGDLARMLRVAPNPEMNSFMWRVVMVQNAIIHGNGYAEIERDNIGRPIALWPIPSEDLELYRTPDGGLVYRVVGGSLPDPSKALFLSPRDVFHLRNFHTKDGLIGQGLAAYAKETLGISLGADRMANSLFANSGIPSGILTVKGTLGDEAFQRVKTEWKEAHGGRKTGGTAILEEGMEYKSISLAPDVLQFLESRKFSVLEIARFLGVPPAKLYDADVSTYNNIEHSNLEVATDTLDAWARNLEMEVEFKLLEPRLMQRCEMDLYAVFRGDMATRSQYFQRMLQSAAITPNEIRKKEGLAPYSGGDRYFVATNNFTPQDRIDEVINSQIKNKEGPEEVPEEPEEDSDVKQAVLRYLESR